MPRQKRATLKQYFEKRDKPTQGQFSDLIDSVLNLEEDRIPTIIYPKGQWVVDFDYVYGDIVFNNGSTYYCILDHTSSSEDEPTGTLTTYWQALSLKGDQGIQGLPGVDAKEVEFRQDTEYLQWRYVGESWTNLIATSELVGPQGEAATVAVESTQTLEPGESAVVENVGTSNAAQLRFKIPKGATGKEIELQKSSTYIQWRYVGETNWNNLIGINEITGADGTDGREVLLQKSLTYIQWKYDNDLNWTNLIAISDLKGDTGQGIAEGGTTGQVLKKKSNTDFDTEWQNDESGTDEKVKYDAGDTTAGYVADKIIAGTGISVAEGTAENENKLVINSTITQATRDSLGLDTDDTVTFANLSGNNTGDQEASDFDIKDLLDSTNLSDFWSAKIDGLSSSTDNALVRFDGITGKIIQNSNAILDDNGNLSIASLLLTPSDGTTNPLQIKRFGSGTATQIKVSNTAGLVDLFYVGYKGEAYFNQSNESVIGISSKGQVYFDTGLASNVGLIIQGRGSQIEDLQQFKNVGGDILSSIQSNGGMTFFSNNQDDAGERLILQTKLAGDGTDSAKCLLAFKDIHGDSKAWLACHHLSSTGTDHSHFSIEISDSGGPLQSRLIFPYDQDICEAVFNQCNLTLRRNSGKYNGNLNIEGLFNHPEYFRFYPYYATNGTYAFGITLESSTHLTLKVFGSDDIYFDDHIQMNFGKEIKGIHKTYDGNVLADGIYTLIDGGTIDGTITIKDGLVSAVQKYAPSSSYTVSRDINGDIIKYTYANGREIDITRVAGIITKYEDSEYEYIIERTGDVFDGLTINEK